MIVYKYELSLNKETIINLPFGSQVLRVYIQHGKVQLWALVFPENELQPRTFEVFGTGVEMPNFKREYINTFFAHGDTYVFHAFERLPG